MSTLEQEKAERPDPLTIPNNRFERFTGFKVEENNDFSKILDEISKKLQAIMEVLEEMDTENPFVKMLVANLQDAVFEEQNELNQYMALHDFKNALISARKYLALLDMIIGDETAILIQSLAKAYTLKLITDEYRAKSAE